VNVVNRLSVRQRPDPAGPVGPFRGGGTDLAVRADAIRADADEAANRALLRTRVHDFLGAHFGDGDPPDADDADDPYRLWMTARALGVSVDAVAPHVREWCMLASARS
jgi:hypothetical protein